MTNLLEAISAAEEKYRCSLEQFFSEKWGDTHLWSHDLDHHMRVWNFAKDLLVMTGENKDLFNSTDIEILLISSYLHDLGMCYEPGEKHGVASSKFCVEFLHRNNLNESDFTGLTDLIKNHDNKSTKTNPGIINSASILASSDDLDAFGYTGIYRYLEIYLLRGTDKGEIGYKIRENAQQRFENFAKNFIDFPSLVEKHKVRFEILNYFFQQYNSQIETKKSTGDAIKAPDIITEGLMKLTKEKIHPSKISYIFSPFLNDPLVSKFIAGFCNELHLISME